MPSLPIPRFFDSLTLRALLIGVLALLMMIPLGFVSVIVFERGQRHAEVLEDIARTWGGPQTLMGPVLVIPYTEATIVENDVIDKDGNASTTRKTVRTPRTARFLPKELEVDATLADDTRERGIFRSLVYAADVRVDARFEPPDLRKLSDAIETVHWSRAWISVGLSDTRAINDVSSFAWNDEQMTLSPGTRLDALGSGFHANLPTVDEETSYSLSLSISTKGSGYFHFAPFGETTSVAMRSSWPHPSFQGDTLPVTHEIADTGFAATWEVPHLARNYPQAWRSDQEQNLAEFTAGVSLFDTVTLYSQVTRATKYGILFIGLTYLTLLIFEITMKRPVHAVQYALVGVALSVFFLVLLALSEHVQFVLAYASASALTILMISLYTAAVLRSVPRGAGVFALLTALYAILYSLLQLEDYALLVGTALLVTIVAVLMLITRNLHHLGSGDGKASGASDL